MFMENNKFDSEVLKNAKIGLDLTGKELDLVALAKESEWLIYKYELNERFNRLKTDNRCGCEKSNDSNLSTV